MESRDSDKNSKEISIKNIINIFLPLFFAIIIQAVVVILDVLGIFIKNIFSKEISDASTTIEDILTKDYTQPMNTAFLSFAQYALYIIIFGIWFYRLYKIDLGKINVSEVKRPSLYIKEGFFSIIKPPVIIPMIIGGVAAQVLVDGILTLIRPFFEEAFAAYDELVSGVTGASASWLMYLSVFVLAPIAEELLFRGVILRYAQKCMPVIAAVLLQGLLFGLYHGNIIQGTYAFILGSLLGYIAVKNQSITAGICFHIAINVSILAVPAAIFETGTSCILACSISAVIIIIAIMVMNSLISHKIKEVE